MSNEPTLGPIQKSYAVASSRKISDAIWMTFYCAIPASVIVKWGIDGRLENAPWLALFPGAALVGLIFAMVRMVRDWKLRVDAHAGGLVVNRGTGTTPLRWDQIGRPTVVVGRSRRLRLFTTAGLIELPDGLGEFDGLVDVVSRSARRPD